MCKVNIYSKLHGKYILDYINQKLIINLELIYQQNNNILF